MRTISRAVAVAARSDAPICMGIGARGKNIPRIPSHDRAVPCGRPTDTLGRI